MLLILNFFKKIVVKEDTYHRSLCSVLEVVLSYNDREWGEWPSQLRRCSKNWKVPSSNPTRRSAGLRDPTSLRGSQWPSGRKCKTQWLTSGEWDCTHIMAQSWPWGSQIAVKKKKYVVFVWLFLPSHTNLSSFNQNIANVKMQDAYYLETSLRGTGSVIIIANDQLRNTDSHLLSFFTRNCKSCRQMSIKNIKP